MDLSSSSKRSEGAFMTIELSHIQPPSQHDHRDQSKIEMLNNYQEITGKIAFLRYHSDQKDLKALKKLKIEKHLDEIICTGQLDKTALQCLMKLRSRKKRIKTYPQIYEKIWSTPEVQQLLLLSPEQTNKQLQIWYEQIRQLDQQLDNSYVRRAVRKIEGKKSVTFSDIVEINLFKPKPGNYQSLKLRIKKLEEAPNSEEREVNIQALTQEVEENCSLKEPGHRDLYFRITRLSK
jgi:hypothetical protein